MLLEAFVCTTRCDELEPFLGSKIVWHAVVAVPRPSSRQPRLASSTRRFGEYETLIYAHVHAFHPQNNHVAMRKAKKVPGTGITGAGPCLRIRIWFDTECFQFDVERVSPGTEGLSWSDLFPHVYLICVDLQALLSRLCARFSHCYVDIWPHISNEYSI